MEIDDVVTALRTIASQAQGDAAKINAAYDSLFGECSNQELYDFARECFGACADATSFHTRPGEAINYAYRVSGAGRIALEVLGRRAMRDGF